MTTIPVEIVRPAKKRSEQVSLTLARLIVMALSILVVMLALGALTPWHLGYWETWLAVWAVRCTLPPRGDYLSWTRSAAKP